MTGQIASERAGRTLVISHWSLPHASFEERVAAAAGAGFDGIGLNVRSYLRMLDEGWTVQRMSSLLDDAGIRLFEVEALDLFDHNRAESVFEMVDAFGPHHVQVVAPLDGRPCPVGPAGERLATLCQRAEPAGTMLAFEFLPFTEVKDVPESLALIRAAGNPVNAGLCVDSWHVFRGAGLGQLDGLPPERVAMVQFDDGPTRPVVDDYFEDTMHHRQTPGEGEFDLVGFLRALPWEAPLSVEVIDDDLDALAPAQRAKKLFDATCAVLAEARSADK